MVRCSIAGIVLGACALVAHAQDITLTDGRVIAGGEIVAWTAEGAIVRQADRWSHVPRSAIARFAPSGGALGEPQLEALMAKYRGLSDRKQAVIEIRNGLKQVGSGPGRDAILADLATLLIADGRYIEALQVLEESPSSILLAQLGKSSAAHARSLTPVVTKTIDMATAQRMLARDRCGLARIPGAGLDRADLAVAATAVPASPNQLADLVLCATCGGKEGSWDTCGTCGGTKTVTQWEEVIIVGPNGGSKKVPRIYKCGPCNATGQVWKHCEGCRGWGVSTAAVPKPMLKVLQRLCMERGAARDQPSARAFGSLAAIARGAGHTLDGTASFQLFRNASQLSDDFASGWESESGRYLYWLRAGLELTSIFNQLAPPLPLQNVKRWPEQAFTTKAAKFLTQDELCADPTTLPNRWLVTLVSVTAIDQVQGLAAWREFRTGLPLRTGGWAGKPELPWLDGLAEGADGRTLKTWLASYPFDDMARRLETVEVGRWYALYGRVQVNPAGLPPLFEVWRAEPVVPIEAGTAPAEPPPVTAPPPDPTPTPEKPSEVRPPSVPEPPSALAGTVGARVTQADLWYADGVRAAASDRDGALRLFAWAKRGYEGARQLAPDNAYVSDQLVEIELRVQALSAPASQDTPGSDARLPYPAAERTSFAALEADLMVLKDQGSERQAALRREIDRLGKPCAPVLLNVLHAMNHADEAEIGVAAFVCDMLVQLFEPEEPPYYDPATEGPRGAKERMAAALAWLRLFKDGALK